MNVFSLFGSIAVDNEAYKRGLNEAERETEKTRKDVTKSTDQMARSVEQRLNRMGSRMQSIGSQMSLALTVPLTVASGAIIKLARDFESSMNRVQGITQATGDQMESLEGLAKELGATTAFSASQAADAMGFLAQAGFSVDEVYSSLPGTLELAAAGQLGLAEAADIASNVLTGFGLKAEEIGRVNDVLAETAISANTNVRQMGEGMAYVAPLAAGMGFTIEETSAAMGLLSDAGIQASAAGTGLRRIMSGLISESDDLGITIRDTSGEVLPLADILGQLEEKGFSAEDAMESFGERGGPALQALLSRGSDALRDLNTQLENAGGTAARLADTQMAGLPGAMYEFESAIQAVGLAIADSGLGDWTEAILWNAASLAQNLSKVNPLVLRLGTIVGGAAIAAGPLLVVLGGIVKLLPTLATGLRVVRTIMLTMTGPVGIIAALATVLGVSLYQAWDNNRKAMDAAVESARDVRKQFEGAAGDTEALKGVVNDLAKEMDGNAGTAFQGFAREALAAGEEAEKMGKKVGETQMAGTLMARVHTLSDELEGDAKTAFINWATQAIASADDVERMAEILEQAYDRINNAAEIAATQQRITRLEMELTERREQRDTFSNTMGAQRVAQLEEGLKRLKEQGASAEQIAIQEERIAQARADSNEATTRLNDALIGVGRQLSEARAQLRELKGLSSGVADDMEEVRKPTITPNVEPDPDVDGADEENPTGLPEDGEEREVFIRVRTDADDFSGVLAGLGAAGREESVSQQRQREAVEANRNRAISTVQAQEALDRLQSSFDSVATQADEAEAATRVAREALDSYTQTLRDHARAGRRAAQDQADAAAQVEANIARALSAMTSNEALARINASHDSLLAMEEAREREQRAIQASLEALDRIVGSHDSVARVLNEEMSAALQGYQSTLSDLAQVGREQAVLNAEALAEVEANRERARGFQAGQESLGRIQYSHSASGSADASLPNPDAVSRYLTGNVSRDAGEGYGTGEQEGPQFDWAERFGEKVSRAGEFLGGLGNAALSLAKEHIPLVGSAMAGFAQGPLAGFAAIISELLGSSEAWKDVQKIFTEILQHAAKALEPLIEAVVMLLDALWPIIEVAIQLVQVALAPLVGLIKGVLAPVITFVARIIAGVWNAIAGALNFILGWIPGWRDLEKIDVDGEAPRPEEPPSEEPTKDEPSPSESTLREQSFNNVNQGVQLAVATPLVEAATDIRASARIMAETLGSGGSFMQHINGLSDFSNVLDRLTPVLERMLDEGVRVYSPQRASEPQIGSSRTAALRGV